MPRSNRTAALARAGARRLDRAGSLQGLLARLTRARRLAEDPTGALARATRLVAAARKARRACRGRLRSLHIGPDGRVIFARAKSAADLEALTVALGDLFAAGLRGTGLVVTVVTRTAPPPQTALRIEDFGRRARAAAARIGAASAALTLGGLAAAPAFADDEYPRRTRESADAATPVARLETDPDWACSFAPPEQIYEVRLDVADGAVRDAQLVGAAQTPGSERVLAFARGLDADLLHRDPLAIVGPGGERIVGFTRYRDARRFDLQIAACPPPPAPEIPAAPAQPAPAPGLFETPRAYRDIGVDYIDRTEQDGLVASGAAQWEIGPDAAANAQLAIGQIDGHLAAGAQLAAQRFMPVGARAEAAVGGFLSAVTSKAPNDDDLSIYRAGAGVSVIGEETQIVVRGGYAAGAGFSDDDGGFVRVEAAWFPIERLALEAFVEDDPITGAGAGVGAAARPFSGVFANLMVDADAAWHEDGEESFRIGLRWLIGDEAAGASERDRRARRGMAPYMPQEFERLPDDRSSTTPYCGEAGEGPSCSDAAPFLD